MKARTAVLSNSYTFHEVKNVISMQYLASLVPRLTPFFSVLWFQLTIIHGCGRAGKNAEGLVSFIMCFMSSGRGGGGGVAQPQICLKTADKVVWII